MKRYMCAREPVSECQGFIRMLNEASAESMSIGKPVSEEFIRNLFKNTCVSPLGNCMYVYISEEKEEKKETIPRACPDCGTDLTKPDSIKVKGIFIGYIVESGKHSHGDKNIIHNDSLISTEVRCERCGALIWTGTTYCPDKERRLGK